jgi:hypothetical protein
MDHDGVFDVVIRETEDQLRFAREHPRHDCPRTYLYGMHSDRDTSTVRMELRTGSSGWLGYPYGSKGTMLLRNGFLTITTTDRGIRARRHSRAAVGLPIEFPRTPNVVVADDEFDRGGSSDA